MELLDRTIVMLKLAESKGFVFMDQIKPVLYEPWMNAAHALCNTAFAMVSMWLRERYKLFVWVTPATNENLFIWHVRYFGLVLDNKLNADESYEMASINGITEALQTLPFS